MDAEEEDEFDGEPGRALPNLPCYDIVPSPDGVTNFLVQYSIELSGLL